ncbi:MAG: ComEC/Rec2 family competence protein [Bdellovibrionota bacterium]
MNNGEALVNALLLGKLEGIEPETISLFARTGLIHLFSASGFHMAVAVQLSRLCTRWPERWLKYKTWVRVLSFLLQLSLMIFFGQATGWSSPMVRAFTFTALLALAKLVEVRPTQAWVFLLSLLLSSLFGKGSFLSFLLSACGMAGILFVKPRNFWALALGPWLCTTPIIIWVFGVFSAAAPLWNLTIGSLVAWFVMPPAVLHLLCTSIGAPDPFFGVAGWIMLRCTELLSLGDQLLGGTFWVPRWPWVIVSLFLALALHFGGRRKLYFAAGILAFALFSPLPRLAVLDVGQGDGIFLRTTTGEKILMDVGPPGYKGREARSAQELGKLGVGAIDQILLSHFDQDHRGGLDSVLRTHLLKGALWFREEALAQKSAVKVLAAAERAGAAIRFLTPESSPKGFLCFFAPADSSNDLSPLCTAALPRGESLWLTGDMSSKAESWLLAHYELPKADYLKVAHHGSRTSSSAAFLQMSSASTALISVGARNRYGHPTQETLERLESAGMKVRRTDQEGSLVFY